ncbi:MAG: Rho termination factor N-terminal domain-containing protein [Desulfobacterales bacterium]|nr:Rho termination factor N-terminal domain-containing protein [Desulfobacterales bacterium]MBS3754620.1 Rho termination factor N-terminal domain-containing protein [Desulfobacterales bacterium]
MGKKEKQTKEKPLEKMTASELRDMAINLPEITGASGMNKTELIKAIKKVKGIEDTGRKKQSDVSVRQIKEKIRELKKQRQACLEQDDKKMADIYRRRISRLKKKTRRVA